MSSYPESSNVIPICATGVQGSTLLIATGCPESGWDRVLPVLELIGNVTSDEEAISILEQHNQMAGTIDVRETGIFSDSVHSCQKSILVLADSNSPELLDQFAQLPMTSFLLFYTNADLALANAMKSGHQNPHQYLRNWQAYNQSLIRFQRRHRMRSLLLNAEAAADNPMALLTACKMTNQHAEPQVSSLQTLSELPILERLLAKLIVRSTFSINSLQLELVARSHPLIENPPESQFGLDSLLRDYRVQKNQFGEMRRYGEQLQNQLDQSVEESNKTITDLTARINQLSKTLAEKTRISIEKETLLLKLQEECSAQTQLANETRVSLTQSENERKKLIEANNGLKEENELLLLQLHQVQEELEHYFLNNQQYAEALDNNNRLIDEKEKMLQSIVKERNDLAELSKELEIKQQQFKLVVMQYRQELDAIRRQSFFRKRTEITTRNKTLRKQILQVRKSGLFNESWYLAEYPDVALKQLHPIQHYLLHGVKEGRNPSSTFNTLTYLENNPDVAKEGINPLLHYILSSHGKGQNASE